MHFDYADESFRPYKQIKETGNYGIFQLKIQTKTSLHSPKNKKNKQAKWKERENGMGEGVIKKLKYKKKQKRMEKFPIEYGEMTMLFWIWL